MQRKRLTNELILQTFFLQLTKVNISRFNAKNIKIQV
jgi:hypothetical protein